MMKQILYLIFVTGTAFMDMYIFSMYITYYLDLASEGETRDI